MERYAWKARILPGKRDEYVKRHNYSIWIVGDEVFGYYECEKGADFAAAHQAQSPVVDRWNEYMKDVMDMEMDPETGAQPKLEEVFYLA